MGALMKRCKTQHCRNLHKNANGYCDACNAEYRRTHPRDFKEYDKKRGSATSRGYDSRWRKFASDYLKEHPTCAICGQPAKIVDHKDIPADLMMQVYGGFDYDLSHYQALCYRCNTKKGRREDQDIRKSYEADKAFIESHKE